MPYADPKKAKENKKRYYQANKATFKKKAQQNYQDNREERLAYAKANGRPSMLRSKYGLSVDDWNEIFEGQDKKCAICASDTPAGKRGWFVDHCHDTGLVRGILCTRCNSLIGAAKDSAATLQALMGYLKRDRKRHAIR
jgi:hypothetical protein